MTCVTCGAELPVGAMFCGECGRAVAASQAPLATASPATSAQSKPRLGARARIAAEIPQTPAADPPTPASPALTPLAPDAEHCSQCGAELAPTDIFCGECGFVRALPRGAPADTAALDPFPWGAVANGTALAPPTSNGPLDPDGSHDPVDPLEDVEATRIVGRQPRGERFVLQFSTGESVTVSGTGLVGRNPVAEPGEYFDAIVRIADPGKSVSKTHLEFGQDAAIFWISDRFSGNGTVFREPESAVRRCDPGKRYRIARGTRVDIGEQFFIVS